MAAVQQFLSLTDDLICILDDQGHILDANSNWKRRLKLSVGDKQKFLDVIEEEDGESRLHQFFNHQGPMVMRIASCRLKDADGKSYWVDLKIRKLSPEKKYWCLIRDISQKRYMSEALEQVSEACNVGHWEYHSSTKDLVWSKKVFEIFNMSQEYNRPTMNDFRNYFSKEDIAELDQVKTPFFNFTFKVNIEGSIKWLYLSGRKEVFADGSYHLQGIVQDKTLEVLKEEVYLSNNVELSSYEKGLDQFTIVARTDERGRIIHANEEFCRISKYSEEELIGRDHRILNSGYHPAEFFEEMWRNIKEGKSWRGEIKNKAKDGSFYWVDTIIIPVRDRDEKLKEILSFRFEITRLKREEEESQALRNQVQLISKLPIPLWSYDAVKKKFDWNTPIKELFMGIKPTHFEGFLELLEVQDQLFIKNCLADSNRTDFQKVMNICGQKVMLHFKLMRDGQGEVIRMDGVFHRDFKEQVGRLEAYFVA